MILGSWFQAGDFRERGAHVESVIVINPGSPIAILFASLIVAASGDTYAVETNGSQKPSLAVVKLKASTKLSWMNAISSDDNDTLFQIIKENDASSLLSLTASNGKSALMVAAKTGDLDLIEALVEMGGNINETTDTQGTPFMFAVLGDNLEVAQWLIEQGADVDAVGSNGWTALTIAAAKGKTPMLQWLIGLEAKTQVRDVYRFTPFMRAVDNGYVETAAVLLSLVETDINAKDEYDNTALHHAVSAGNIAMINLLLEHHADVRAVNRDGVSPLVIAQSLDKNSKAILSVLESESLP